MSQILRWVVPVDGQPHRIPAGVRHVAARKVDGVEVWTTPSNEPDLVVSVVGTGHSYPPHWCWVGTCLAPGGLVWHLMDTGGSPLDLPAATGG